MKQLRTHKLKITSKHENFLKLAIAYKEAVNWLSSIVFKRKKINTPTQLSKEFYSTIREKFKLTSQLTCSLFRHVVSTYRSMKVNKQWNLAIYKKSSIPLCWKRDFNLRKKGLSIWGELVSFQSKRLPEGKWSDSKLKFIKNNWYLCLTIEIDIPEQKEKGGIIGVDRGQNNVFCAVDPKTNKTLYYKGNELNHRRHCIRQTRAKIASVGTRSAKRLLKRLSGREKAVTQEIMHIASKRLVNFAESVNARAIVMEDLTGIRNTKSNQKQIARNNRWPYALFEFLVNYKSKAVGIGLDHVSARYTSQSCPKCGFTDKNNRKGLQFKCIECNYRDNSDRIGASNIALRLLLQRQAVGERAMYQLAYSGDGENSFNQSQTSSNLGGN